jgi:hypothetical protein
MPTTPKSYLHDKLILLLLALNIFLAFLCSTLIIWRLSSGQTGDYIVQRRANLGIDQYTQGNVVPMLSFIVFTVFVLVLHTLLSAKAYNIQKQLSIIILGFGTLLLITATIVSNALLALH